jgi:hypothetical protein
MKYLILLTLPLFIGCTKSSPACTIQQTIESGIASTIASELSCVHPDAIKATLDVQFAKLNLCKDQIIGEVVCGPIVDALMSGALSTLPKEWGCTGGSAGDGLKAKLLAVCKAKLP